MVVLFSLLEVCKICCDFRRLSGISETCEATQVENYQSCSDWIFLFMATEVLMSTS